MTYKSFVGIDPGVKGGIAIITNNHIHVRTFPILEKSRLDAHELAGWLEFKLGMKDALGIFPQPIAFIEDQWLRKSDNPRVGKLIENFGCLYGILAGLKVEYKFVAPKTWQASLSVKSKEDAIQICKSNYSDVNLLPTKRSRKPHTGIADALCIAHYGRLLSTVGL